MRINLYAEELTTETETIVKSPENHPGTDFYGIRLYLKSPSELHDGADDDDRTAITFWVPWTRKGGLDFGATKDVFYALLNELDLAQTAAGQ